MLCCPREGSAQKFSSLQHFTKSTMDRNGLWSTDRPIGKSKQPPAFFPPLFFLSSLTLSSACFAFVYIQLCTTRTRAQDFSISAKPTTETDGLWSGIRPTQLKQSRVPTFVSPSLSVKTYFSYLTQSATLKTISSNSSLTTDRNDCYLFRPHYCAALPSLSVKIQFRRSQLINIFFHSLLRFPSQSPHFLRMCSYFFRHLSFTTTDCVSAEIISGRRETWTIWNISIHQQHMDFIFSACVCVCYSHFCTYSETNQQTTLLLHETRQLKCKETKLKKRELILRES